MLVRRGRVNVKESVSTGRGTREEVEEEEEEVRGAEKSERR